MSEPRGYALITGAANGLGRALALALARDGWHVAIADVDVEASQQTLALIGDAGGSGQVEPLDVSRPEQWQALAVRLVAQWPRLDLLANVAGVAVSGEVGHVTLDNWRWSLDVNLMGTIFGCHTFVPWLKQNPRGAHIVNVASIAAFASLPAMAPYNVAKAGVVALSETMYAELRNANVGVTVVAPGFFASGLLERGRFAQPSHREFTSQAMRDSRLSVDDLARATLHAVRKRQFYVVLPRRARIFWWLKRMLPTRVLRFVASRYRSEIAE
ncbi:MAG TPA: SDR family NAD(P)-dependent oxidoreductase [Pirellulales bacterium]|jgi:NAD(P)-dependent dehydrogenase (short-subunit alcohol dehydrogenase family)|nr:SDR family NAD(P)-dependent oxidoreductase [Pirellulales bacterium]